MRSRFILSFFALLLLTASLASAAPTGRLSTPATGVASSPEDPSCDPLLAELGISLDTSSPTDKTTTLVCGACSVLACRGAVYNSICQGGTVVKRCIAAYGLSCTDGTPQCQCWSGPLP